MANVKSQLKTIIREHIKSLLKEEELSDDGYHVTFIVKGTYDELTISVPPGKISHPDEAIEYALGTMSKGDPVKQEQIKKRFLEANVFEGSMDDYNGEPSVASETFI